MRNVKFFWEKRKRNKKVETLAKNVVFESFKRLFPEQFYRKLDLGIVFIKSKDFFQEHNTMEEDDSDDIIAIIDIPTISLSETELREELVMDNLNIFVIIDRVNPKKKELVHAVAHEMFHLWQYCSNIWNFFVSDKDECGNSNDYFCAIYKDKFYKNVSEIKYEERPWEIDAENYADRLVGFLENNKEVLNV